MTLLKTFRRDWLSNIRGDVLAGIVVALALIPEAIGFSVLGRASMVPEVALVPCAPGFVWPLPERGNNNVVAIRRTKIQKNVRF